PGGGQGTPGGRGGRRGAAPRGESKHRGPATGGGGGDQSAAAGVKARSPRVTPLGLDERGRGLLRTGRLGPRLRLSQGGDLLPEVRRRILLAVRLGLPLRRTTTTTTTAKTTVTTTTTTSTNSTTTSTTTAATTSSRTNGGPVVSSAHHFVRRVRRTYR